MKDNLKVYHSSNSKHFVSMTSHLPSFSCYIKLLLPFLCSPKHQPLLFLFKAQCYSSIVTGCKSFTYVDILVEALY